MGSEIFSVSDFFLEKVILKTLGIYELLSYYGTYKFFTKI